MITTYKWILVLTIQNYCCKFVVVYCSILLFSAVSCEYQRRAVFS